MKTNPIIQHGHSSEIQAADCDSQGRYLLSADQNHGVKLWDMQNNTLIREYHLPMPADCISLSDKLDYFVTGFANVLFIVNFQTGEYIQQYVSTLKGGDHNKILSLKLDDDKIYIYFEIVTGLDRKREFFVFDLKSKKLREVYLSSLFRISPGSIYNWLIEAARLSSVKNGYRTLLEKKLAKSGSSSNQNDKTFQPPMQITIRVKCENSNSPYDCFGFTRELDYLYGFFGGDGINYYDIIHYFNIHTLKYEKWEKKISPYDKIYDSLGRFMRISRYPGKDYFSHMFPDFYLYNFGEDLLVIDEYGNYDFTNPELKKKIIWTNEKREVTSPDPAFHKKDLLYTTLKKLDHRWPDLTGNQ